ncbi:MAG TPA: hypothetical protein DCS93_43545 [Microscillaceae bacterium]|nr:hypothetical protein [Microscillaceae bacterium]
MKDLASKINKASRLQGVQSLVQFRDEVQQVGITDFVVFMLRQYSFPLGKLLIPYITTFEQLPLKDWIYILKRLSDEQLKYYPTALDVFLITSYVMLEIDFIEEYADLDDVDQEFQKDFLEDYIERPGRLHFNEYYQSILNQAGVNKSIFKNVKQHLLSEGATEAIEIIMPSPDIMYGVQVQHMQFDSPDWPWAKKYISSGK